MKAKDLIAIATLLAAASVSAAPLTFNFTATDGTNFSVDRASAVEKVTGGVKVTKYVSDATGTTVPFSTAYADTNGTVFAKFQTVASTSGLFLRIGTSNRYIGAAAPASSLCFGSSSILTYSEGTANASETLSGDGCSIVQGIKAISN